jgi:hypothetical protein
LSKVINEEAAEHDKELLKTTDVTQKGQDIGYLPRIRIVVLIRTDVYSNEDTIVVAIVVIICLNIEYLVEIHVIRLAQLHIVVFEGGFLEANIKIGSLGYPRVDLKEKLIVQERLERLFIIFEDEHGVNKSKTEAFMSEILIND